MEPSESVAQVEPEQKGEPQKPTDPQPLNKLDRAEAAVKRMEELDVSLSEKLTKLEALQTEKILGGGSEAGSAEATPKEESDKDYRARINKELAEGKYDRKDR